MAHTQPTDWIASTYISHPLPIDGRTQGVMHGWVAFRNAFPTVYLLPDGAWRSRPELKLARWPSPSRAAARLLPPRVAAPRASGYIHRSRSLQPARDRSRAHAR